MSCEGRRYRYARYRRKLRGGRVLALGSIGEAFAPAVGDAHRLVQALTQPRGEETQFLGAQLAFR